MAEEVIPGVPRSVAPLTRRLCSVHARLDLYVHRFKPKGGYCCPSFVGKLQRLELISPFVFAREKCSS
jgi:hypothetical protein